MIVGDDEAAAGELTLKPLRTTIEQQRMRPAEAVERVRAVS